MTLKDKIFFGAAVVVVAIVAVFSVLSFTKGNGSTPSLGAVGNMLAENYIPFVRMNSGYNSAFPITTSGALTSGAFAATTGTFSGNVNVTTSNTATSTITVGCFQFYATSTATAQKFMASTTPGIMYSQYGTCP